MLPSLPGYGFSGEPVEVGWDLGRTARAWAELMRRLGYTRYVAQGGDVGAGVTDAMGRQAPEGLIGIHTNLLVPALSGTMPTDTDEERAAAAQIATFGQSGNGYYIEMATRPQTIGYALLDSPVALAAWMIDHDTDAYYKIARAFVDGQPSGNLTRDNVLDNITTYWLTGTGASAARSYWEAYGPDAPAAGRQPLPPPPIPVGFTTFPGEIWRTPRSWVESRTPTSSTSTKSTGAATSPPGRSRSSSRVRCGQLSGHCVDRHVRAVRTKGCVPLAACSRSVLRSLASRCLRAVYTATARLRECAVMTPEKVRRSARTDEFSGVCRSPLRVCPQQGEMRPVQAARKES